MHWFCGYPINREMVQTLQRILIPTTQGKCMIIMLNLYHLILSCTIILYVSISLLSSAGTSVLLSSEHQNIHKVKGVQILSVLGDNSGIMLGHYLLFLMELKDCLLIYIGIILAKWKIIMVPECTAGHSFNDFLTLLMAWLCTKYQFHFPLGLLIYACARLLMPMSNFYRLLKTGKKTLNLSLYVNGLISLFMMVQEPFIGSIGINGNSP